MIFKVLIHRILFWGIEPHQLNNCLTDDDLSEKSLNLIQRQVFDFVYTWAKSYIIFKSVYGKYKCQCHSIDLFQLMEAVEIHI